MKPTAEIKHEHTDCGYAGRYVALRVGIACCTGDCGCADRLCCIGGETVIGLLMLFLAICWVIWYDDEMN